MTVGAHFSNSSIQFERVLGKGRWIRGVRKFFIGINELDFKKLYFRTKNWDATEKQ